MSDQQTPATIPAPEKKVNPLVALVAGAPDLTPQGVKTWTMMGQGKIAMDALISKHVLVLQNLLADMKVCPLDMLTPKLAEYKKVFQELQIDRMKYTGIIDILKDKCMEAERPLDPANSEAYKAAQARELELRRFASKKQADADLLQQERVKFKAHINNQYLVIASDFKRRLDEIGFRAYENALTNRTPAEHINIIIESALVDIRAVKPIPSAKYNRVQKTDGNSKPVFDGVDAEGKPKPVYLLSDAECKAIVQQVPQIDYAKIGKECIEAMRERFNTYENALAAADKVLPQAAELFATEQAKVSGETAAAIASNVLMASVDAINIPAAGFKAITETTRIKIESKNPKWVAAILAAFLSNFNIAFDKVKVKDYDKLTVRQMAAALDDAGVKVENEYITYETVVK